MIQIVWQYQVKEEFRATFELAYGLGSAWSQLFGNSPGFRGTALLRDTHNPHSYLTLDSWDSEEHREADEEAFETGTPRRLGGCAFRKRQRRRNSGFKPPMSLRSSTYSRYITRQ
jgi:heme-degrading monooxygenase HmoA